MTPIRIVETENVSINLYTCGSPYVSIFFGPFHVGFNPDTIEGIYHHDNPPELILRWAQDALEAIAKSARQHKRELKIENITKDTGSEE